MQLEWWNAVEMEQSNVYKTELTNEEVKEIVRKCQMEDEEGYSVDDFEFFAKKKDPSFEALKIFVFDF